MMRISNQWAMVGMVWRNSEGHGNKIVFKLTNAFFFIGLDWSRLPNLSRSRSIGFVDSEHILCHWSLGNASHTKLYPSKSRQSSTKFDNSH